MVPSERIAVQSAKSGSFNSADVLERVMLVMLLTSTGLLSMMMSRMSDWMLLFTIVA